MSNSGTNFIAVIPDCHVGGKSGLNYQFH